MKALILDASPSPDDPSARAAGALESVLRHRGARVSLVRLRTLSLHPCNGCFGCWTKRPGECLIDDDARGVAAKIIAADLVALAGPVRFGAWHSLAKSALDRIIGLVLPHFTMIDGEVHHEPRYARYPRWISLGTMPRPDREAQALFVRLMDRNAVNFHCPAHAAGVLSGDEDAMSLAGQLVASTEGVA